MNVTIQPASGMQLLDYRVELVTPPQPFYHTAIQVTGSFGRILLTKIDLRHCTIWIADYHVIEPITLHGFINEVLYQVYFPIPASFGIQDKPIEEKKQAASQPHVYLSVTDNLTVQLPMDHSRMLLIHYTRQYFNSNGSAINETLMDIFIANAGNPVPPLLANAATVSVIKQIIYASPANRIVHLYLEAKVKKLLVLFYQLANPEPAVISLSEKEIKTLEQVKSIIMADLSVTYNSYELSRLTGINAYTLKTNFKTWFGIPLHHFLHNCRMEKATELLLQSQLSVKEIAFAVGYKNVSNFSESFKNYYGYSPSKTREPG
jgi:AraC-like DNA-binding protein